MSIIKVFDDEYKEYQRLRHSLYHAYYYNNDNLTSETLTNYDKFILLYPIMKKRYNIKITCKGFIKWLDDIDEFEP